MLNVLGRNISALTIICKSIHFYIAESLFYYKKKKNKKTYNIFTLKHLSFKYNVSPCNLSAMKILYFYDQPSRGKNREVHFIGSLLFTKVFSSKTFQFLIQVTNLKFPTIFFAKQRGKSLRIKCLSYSRSFYMSFIVIPLQACKNCQNLICLFLLLKTVDVRSGFRIDFDQPQRDW